MRRILNLSQVELISTKGRGKIVRYSRLLLIFGWFSRCRWGQVPSTFVFDALFRTALGGGILN